MGTFVAGVELYTVDCSCGGTYAISERYRLQRKEEGKSWHCPYCEVCWGYGGDGDNDRLKRKVAQLQSQNDQLDASVREGKRRHQVTKKRLSAQKGVTTRLKNRAAAGMCPCCHRSFQNLKRHMDGQHPDFAEHA